ncbi:MAG: nucleotide exchange factor GrpE [Solirubrobacteraceae bacterium]
MGPDRHPFEKSDGATAPEAAPVASGADAAADPGDAFAPAEGEDAGSRLTDEEQESALAGAAEAEHERKVELDLEELVAKAERADEYLELARRTKADFENYRKRAAREAAAAQERGVTKLARELLPAIDNLERALAAAGGEALEDDGAAHTLSSGIKLVLSELVAALSRVGIEGFSPEGEAFDPQRHEAMAQHPVPGAEPGTVVEVYQRGYALGEAVLRPARVVVAG